MVNLILIKHSLSAIEDNVPPIEWQLSEEGRVLAKKVATQLKSYQLHRILTSTHPTALETAKIIGETLECLVGVLLELNEFQESIGWKEELRLQKIHPTISEHTNKVISDSRITDEVGQRFSDVLNTAMYNCKDETIGVIAHGSVIDVMVSRWLKLGPNDFWQTLDFPNFVALSWPKFSVIKIARRLDAVKSNLKWDSRGLITAVVQDFTTHEVLMVAWMSAEALRLTQQTGEAWFWSRSRQELWHKGATSGNVLHVKEIRVDCDGDTLLLLVEPNGPACHTGANSCFFTELSLTNN